jgi:hypothetical protein
MTRAAIYLFCELVQAINFKLQATDLSNFYLLTQNINISLSFSEIKIK